MRILTLLTLLLFTSSVLNAQSQREEEEQRAALQLLVNDGNNAFRQARYADAQRLYLQALGQVSPGLPAEQVPMVHLNLAHAHYQQEHWLPAIEAYRSSSAEDKLQWIAQCHLQLGNFYEALHALQDLLVLFPEKDEMRKQLVQLHSMLGHTEVAEKLYRELIKATPGDVELRRALVGELLNQGRNEEAIDFLESIRLLGNSDSRTSRLLGDLYLQQGMHREAAAWYQKFLAALQTDGEDVGPEDFFRIGYSYYQSGEHTSAHAFFAQAVEADPSYARGFLFLGHVAIAEGSPDRALGEFQNAIEMDEGLGAAHEAIAGIMMRRGEFDSAARAFAKAIEMGVSTIPVHFNRVVTLVRADQRARAIVALKDALRLHPDSDRLRSLLEMLR